MQTVTIKNLTKKFSSSVAIDDLSLNIEKGKITGLIGADGAGKTTLLRTIIGLLLADNGEVNVLGFNPVTQKDELNLHIGYMPQKFGLYEDLTVIENLKLYADLKNVPHDFDKMLEFTTLAPFQDRLAGALSGGMKQKLGLACTLLGNPEFLLLDEPSVGVDPISRRDLIKMVREMITPETTVLWSTAYLDEAHNFDTAVVLDKGKVIYEGKPHDLAPTPQEFENKVIDLMGGYNKEESLIAQNYDYK
ncbi:ABC transporter ATP-binding protein, partial [bacterium]|nr:ABC transporter ATP-binding protein [bacterium]